MSNKKICRYLIASIVCLSAVLRFYNLGGKGLWQDEQWTHVISGRDLSDLIAYLKVMADRPPLHLILTRFAILLRESEFFIRLIPAIFGVGCIIAIYETGKRFFSKKEALIAAFLLSISPYHINYSQEATAYTLFLFFSLLSLLMLYLSLEGNRWTQWSGFILCSALTLYSSYFGIFLIASLMISVTTMWAVTHFIKNTGSTNRNPPTASQEPFFVSNKIFIKCILSTVLIGLLYLPWIPVLLSSFTKYSGDAATTWISLSPSLFINIFREFSGNTNIPVYFFLLLFSIGFFSSLKSRVKTHIIIFWCITTPFLIIFILKPAYHFFSRYVIFILPLYLLGIAQGITFCAGLINSRFKIKESYTAGLFVVCISIVLLPSMVKYYKFERRDWRSVAALVEKESLSGDIVAIEPAYLYYPFFYYLNIKRDLKMNLIDPLTPARPVNLIFHNPTKKIAVCHFMTIMKPGLLKKYKRLWYIISAGASPDWVTGKFRLIKRFPGASKVWDVSVYLIEIDELIN